MTRPEFLADDAVAPVVGDPSGMRALGLRMSAVADGLAETAAVLDAIEAVDWRGVAAAAFHAVLREQPRRYLRAAEAFGVAAEAIFRYAAVVEDAQAATGRAAQLAQAGDEATRVWVAVSAASLIATATGDPGWPDRQLAATISASARAEVQAAATAVAAVLHEAARDAPSHPSWFHQFVGDCWRSVVGGPHQRGHRIRQGYVVPGGGPL